MIKKTILTIAAVLMFAVPSFAQYWSTTSSYDPFKNGEKHLGIAVGLGGWFSKGDALLNTSYGPYEGYRVTKVTRLPISPSAGIHFKRILQGKKLDYGNSFIISFNKWTGKVKGINDSSAVTFTSKYSYADVTLTDLYTLMIPIGEKIHVSAGVGMSIGIGLTPKASIEYSDGNTEALKGGLEFSDLLIARLDAVLGFDYILNNTFTFNAMMIGYPIDIFGGLMGDNPGYHSVGGDLFVKDKFPFQLMVGCTLAL
ncbi:MAG: hypothetical protein J6Y98_06575 [Bacteroidales bacterium]|nr:hypothetical protein [Bacteroidales bacterium]MCR5192438.1 hypothetical protein [Bacteroidales bacterium]